MCYTSSDSRVCLCVCCSAPRQWNPSLSVTWHLALGRRPKSVTSESVSARGVSSPHIHYISWMGLFFYSLSSLSPLIFISLPFLQTGSVMNVLRPRLAVFSLPPSSLCWCLSGGDHLTQVFHIIPSPPPHLPPSLPSLWFTLVSSHVFLWCVWCNS